MKKAIWIGMIVVAAALFTHTGYYKKVKEVFSNNKISIEEEFSVSISCESYHFTEQGIIMNNDISLWMIDNQGEKKWQHDFEKFSDKIFCYENIYRTGKDSKTLEIINYSGEIIGKTHFEDEIYHIFKGKNPFVVLKTQDNKDKYAVINSSGEVMGTNTYDRGRITFVTDTKDTEGHYSAGFSAEGKKIKTFLYKYLNKEIYQLWKISFEDEVIMELFSQGNHVFIKTNKMLYMIDENGKIMWRYSGKGYPWKTLINGKDIYIVDDKNPGQIHILGKDGQVRENIEIKGEIRELFKIDGKVYAAGSNNIYGIKGGIAFEIMKFTKTPDKIFCAGEKVYIIEEDKIKVYKIII